MLAHARALLTSSPEGATSYIDADLHDPEAILAEAAETLDFDQPVALLLIGVLGHVADYDEARSIVRALLDGLPSGSYLVESDGTDSSPEYLAAIEMYRDSGGVPYNVRTHEQIAGYYEGLDLVEPGVVPIHLWRPEPNAFGEAPDVSESGRRRPQALTGKHPAAGPRTPSRAHAHRPGAHAHRPQCASTPHGVRDSCKEAPARSARAAAARRYATVGSGVRTLATAVV